MHNNITACLNCERKYFYAQNSMPLHGCDHGSFYLEHEIVRKLVLTSEIFFNL